MESHFPGFARGKARYGDYVFIGLSKLRKNHNTFGDLPIAANSLFCGVVVLHLPTGRLAGSVRYLTACEDNLHRPSIFGIDSPIFHHALATPTVCFWIHLNDKVNG